jgi:hypothetical protein
VVIAHRFAFALAYGVGALDQASVLGHRCDYPLCQRVGRGHLVASSTAQNRREWVIRRLLAGIRWPTRGVRAGVPASCGISPGRIRARLPPI